MNAQDLQINGLYVIVDPCNKKKSVVRYSGTTRVVKDLIVCWYFYTEDDKCIFLIESEVNNLTEFKISVQ
jgi:hypothetical protein